MKMKKVAFEELLAGAILKFGKVDSVDMALLIRGLEKFDRDIEYVDAPLYENMIKQYIQTTNGVISIKNGLSLNTNVSHFADDRDYSLEKLLTVTRGKIVGKYLEELNIENFVLRKVRLLSYTMPVEKLNDIFNPIELAVVIQLLENGMIGKKWNEDIPHQDFEELFITKLGRVQLFMEDYKEEIEAFATSLKSLRYNTDLLYDFLTTQDMQKSPREILNIVAFNDFGNNYDLCLDEKNVSSRLVKTDETKK